MKSNELLPILVKIKELSLQLAKAIDLVVDPVKKIAPEKEEKKVEEKTTPVVVEEPKKEITLDEVRTALASLFKDGYTNDLKVFLRKYCSKICFFCMIKLKEIIVFFLINIIVLLYIQ